MPFTNTEKQARFRQKAELERKASAVLEAWRLASDDPQYVSGIAAQIASIVELPAGWTNEEFAWAERELKRLKFLSNGPPSDELAVEITQKHLLDKDLPKDTHPSTWEKVRKDKDNILQNTRLLRQHLVSAIRLVKATQVDSSVAVLALAREVGTDLLSERAPIPAPGSAICLIALPVEFDRPPWVIETFAEWLRSHLTEEERGELVNHLQTEV